MVQKTFWGLPWWDRKIVLLTFFVRGGKGFKRGETYFVEGNRESRRLTRPLPIFEVHCTRTAGLKYAEIDLRALRDGPPKNSVRIMGYTYRRTSVNESTESPSTKVGIRGPAGETTITSDSRGFYDIGGLPPGAYDVHGMDPQAGPYWAHPVCYWTGSQSLKTGDVVEPKPPRHTSTPHSCHATRIPGVLPIPARVGFFFVASLPPGTTAAAKSTPFRRTNSRRPDRAFHRH